LLATAVAFGGELRVANLPGGELMVERSGVDRSYYLLGLDGKLRPIRRPPGGLPLAADRNGNTYHVDGRGVGRRSPDGAYEVIASGFEVVSLDAAADGTVYAIPRGAHTVVRIERDGSRTKIAGTGQPGFSGDGGPADAAALRSPASVAVARDTSLLIADAGNRRIRRVGEGGRITTVAGNGRSGWSGDRGPATAARLSAPIEIEPGPHGGFAFIDADRVRRVTRGGEIGTLAASRRGGREQGRGTSMLIGDGDNGKTARTNVLAYLGGGQLARTEEGGYALVDSELLRYLPAPRRPRLAMAIRTVVPERRRVSYTVTTNAQLRLQVVGHGRRLGISRTVGPGHGYFRLPRALPAGGYRVQLDAKNGTGDRVAREAAFLTMPALSTRAARGVMLAFESDRALITPRGLDTRARPSDDGVPTRCRRFGQRRVDCVIAINVEPITGCENIASVRLERQGQVSLREYACGEFLRGPARRLDWDRVQLLTHGPDD